MSLDRTKSTSEHILNASAKVDGENIYVGTSCCIVVRHETKRTKGRWLGGAGLSNSTLWPACPRVFKQYFSKSLDRQNRMYRVTTKIARSIFTDSTLCGVTNNVYKPKPQCINDLWVRIVVRVSIHPA
ncbi:hypothetical protein J6590_091780 [Homalodisca vitripennis]|nr:hypothetical protein J6590_091780 [Homalodisca vitripennis]